MRITKTLAAVVTAAAALAVAGCGGASDESGGGSSSSASSGNGDGAKATLSLVAYSTPQVVYDEIIPAFQKTPAGEGIGFKTSFGASGDQSRAVEAGQKADVVTFSTEPDMTRLVEADLVKPNWNQGPTKGLVTTSVVSFVVRKGNPKNIQTWDDLLKPGVQVLTPNPFSSGAAKWNLLAAYGQASDGGKNRAAGLDYVRKLITDHVRVQDKSGREALQNFIGGNGDVLLSYEYEAITANKKGESLDYVIPDDTIKIDIDIATTSAAPQAAGTFLDYVLSKPAQEKFASWGYRPVNEEVLAANKSKFPDSGGPVHDRRPRRLEDGRRRAVRHRERRDRQDRGRGGGVDRQVSSVAVRLRTRPAARPGALGARDLDAVAQPHRPAAAGGRRRCVHRGRLGHVLERDLEPPGGGGAALHAGGVARLHGDQRGQRHADRLGARARPVPGQAAGQRGHRPAVRAADDRRRPHAARALRPDQPARRQRRVHAVRGAAGAAVRDAAVRDPLASSRC